MTRKSPETPAKSYTYGQIEKALATALGVDAAGQVGWLRGRIQHLRRLGLTPEGPGRGRTINYTREDADQWLIALALAHGNADPTRLVQLIKKNWDPPRRKRTPEDAMMEGEATFSDLVESARASRKPETDVIVTIHYQHMSDEPWVGYTTVRGIGSFAHWLRGDHDDPSPRLATSFCLTTRLRALDKVLDAAPEPDSEKIEVKAPPQRMRRERV
jgi:hypothetical protein